MMILLGIVLAAAVFAAMLYNQIVHAKIKVEEAKSGIDVALAKRYSVLNNMQESVKEYMKHESSVLEKLTEIRKSMSVSELAQVKKSQDSCASQILFLAESYPELKASELFHDFNEALVDCEEHVQAARRFYNSNVTLYNQKLQMFPSSLMAQAMKAEKADFFEAEAFEREAVQASF